MESRATSPWLTPPPATNFCLRSSSSCNMASSADLIFTSASRPRSAICDWSLISRATTWFFSTWSPSSTNTSRTTPLVRADAAIGNGDGSTQPGACTTAPRGVDIGAAFIWLSRVCAAVLAAEFMSVFVAVLAARMTTGTALTIVSGAHARQLDHARMESALNTITAGNTTRVPMRRLGRGIVDVMASPPLEEILRLWLAQVARCVVAAPNHSTPTWRDSKRVAHQ